MGNTLSGALPEMIAADAKLRQLAAAEGISYGLADDGGGIRSQSDTTRDMTYRAQEYPAYVAQQQAAGRSVLSIEKWRPIAPFGSSFHNYGAAEDVKVTSWPATKSADWALTRLQQLAPQAGLRSGVTFNDPGHLELAVTLDQVRARWAALGNTPGQVGLPSIASIPFLTLSIPGVQLAQDTGSDVDTGLFFPTTPVFTGNVDPMAYDDPSSDGGGIEGAVLGFTPSAPFLIAGVALLLGGVVYAARRRRDRGPA